MARPGTVFEHDVRSLLAVQGWNVKPETLLAHKQVDLYAEKSGHFGRRERIAVECKDYARPLSQSEVAEIYASYLPLLEAGLVDQVVAVTAAGLTPSALAYCSTARSLTHVTYLDLLNSSMDFSVYLRGLVHQYEEDDLSQYYVPQRFSQPHPNESDLSYVEDEVLRWIDSADEQPVAILASYGMGKTTLARRLAFVLAKRHLADPRNCLPVLINLEELGSEQSLEGLIGSQFTSRSIIPNYNFNIFMELNKLGRFVILLDGFDEMKQAISWETMRYNFGQLNRLATPLGKLILSGRPSAFVTDEEYLEALHGKRRILGDLRNIPGWPDYREIHLEVFSDEEIALFIARYTDLLAYRSSHGRSRLDLRQVVDKLDANGRESFLALARRPVQLRMIVEVLPSWSGKLDDLTLTVLYSEFIDLIIRRELAKRARQYFSIDERREFARELAWWMWTEGEGLAVAYSKIPDELFPSVGDRQASLEDVKRDLLSACFLEVKQPHGYYFPHRSFQEFLVAEKVVELLSQGRFDFKKIININQEIHQFIEAMLGQSQLKRLGHQLLSYRGTLQDWTVELLLRLVIHAKDYQFGLPGGASPWHVAILSTALITGRWPIWDEQRMNPLKACLSIPDGVSNKTEWAKLIVVNTILLREHLAASGIDFRQIIREHMEIAGTAGRFAQAKKVRLGDFLEAHFSPRFCHLESWTAAAEAGRFEVFGVRGAGSPEDQSGAKATRGKGKGAHRLHGVTKKKDFRASKWEPD